MQACCVDLVSKREFCRYSGWWCGCRWPVERNICEYLLIGVDAHLSAKLVTTLRDRIANVVIPKAH